jgi:RNA polymerase sigma factor (sigma-70 family)
VRSAQEEHSIVVGKGAGDVAEVTRIVAEPVLDEDQRLVAGVRRGDDRAFEALYSRYHRRIHAYVMGMVKDHGRAEDITQEVFVSALRRMRETERPIAFKPWIYEIAKNACIDQFRRSRRAEEISLQADDGFAPNDYGRLVGSDPAPHEAVAAKQELDNLCGAFGGLSDTHHEILVLRELEGLSYREIGDRMGMSRPAVESTLFRARKRLTEEYDELVSGARCLRIQSLITMARDTRLGARESRRLSRHVAYCLPCRREAMAAGLDAAILTHVPLRKRAAAKIGSLLPFPIFARWRGADWMAHAGAMSDQASSGWGKLATAAAVLVAGVGAAGVGTQIADGGGDPGPKRAVVGSTAPAQSSTGGTTAASLATRAPAKTTASKPAARKTKRHTSRARTRNGASGGSGASRATPTAGSGGSNGTSSGSGGANASNGGGSGLPKVKVPASTGGAGGAVKETVDQVAQSVPPVVGAVTETVEQATQPVTDATGSVGDSVDGVVGGVNGTANGVVGGVSGTVDGVVDGLP